MKFLRASLTWLLLPGCIALAQEAGPVPPGATAIAPATPGPEAGRSAAEFESLLAPIALYPDALLALILPAATAPADVVLAARFLREPVAGRAQVEAHAWDESVKSLAYYPEVLKWMDENLEWTKQVGEAFEAQPVAVMQAVQRLRAQARAAGTLVNTPQQQVISEIDLIRIVPTQANAIYVPYYQPTMVFLREPLAYPSSRISFGLGLPVGSWLAYECDWRRSTIWMGNRHRPWKTHDWRRPLVPVPLVASPYGPSHGVRPWRPTPHSPHRAVTLPPPPTSPRVAPPAGRSTLARTFAPKPIERRTGSGFAATERNPAGPRPVSLAPLSVPQVVPAPVAAIPFGQVPARPQAIVPPPAPAHFSPRNPHPRPVASEARPGRAPLTLTAPGFAAQLPSSPHPRREITRPAHGPAALPTAPAAPASFTPPASRTRPPPASTPAARPAATPDPAAPPAETGGERTVGRRQPNAHLR